MILRKKCSVDFANANNLARRGGGFQVIRWDFQNVCYRYLCYSCYFCQCNRGIGSKSSSNSSSKARQIAF
jgi:hypothetical protein